MSFDHEAEHRDINARKDLNRQRLLDLAIDYHNLADRLGKIEDYFEVGGIIQQLTEDHYRLAAALEALIDGQQRPRRIDAEHDADGVNPATADPSASAVGEG